MAFKPGDEGQYEKITVGGADSSHFNRPDTPLFRAGSVHFKDTEESFFFGLFLLK
ncbi:MAG: hypothetical protein AAB969_03495 [Patescibacteria group bacterium]